MNAKNGLFKLSALDAIDLVKSKRISVTELVNSCMKQIKELDDKIKAWEYFNEDYVLFEAKKIDEKINANENPGPLYGIPIGIKDIFNTTDMPTCMGSPIWTGFTPGNDARVVYSSRFHGGIVMGKTATAEFATHYPPSTVNPHNYDYASGTSSSGSAAAVASYMVPLALGTQTAGSTIRPASYCGVFGFKPSFGTLPRTGILKTLDTLDHVTMFARTVNDIHLYYDTIRLKGPNYPFINDLLESDKASPKPAKGDKWRIGFVKTHVWGQASAYAQEAILKFCRTLKEEEGFIVEEIDLPENFKKTHEVHDLIYTKALSYYFNNEYEYHKEKVSKQFCKIVERGRTISKEEYRTGLIKQLELKRELDGFFDQYDALISLSTAGEALKDKFEMERPDPCLMWTLCHVPSINLPIFKGPNNLPFGAQIISRRYKDYSLFKLVQLMGQKGLINDWRDWE